MNTGDALYIIIMTTCASQAEADQIATRLVQGRLAACVQTHSVNSTYQWKGVVETSPEIRMLIKARASDYAAIEASIQSIHSYENPQILAIPVFAGAKLYLDWIEAETTR